MIHKAPECLGYLPVNDVALAEILKLQIRKIAVRPAHVLKNVSQPEKCKSRARNYQSVFCYGYVADWNGTPLRRTPSASAQSLTWLNRYAMCRVYGPYTYGGETWFNVSCRVGSSQYTGYVPASALKMLSEEELAAFVETPEYFSGN